MYSTQKWNMLVVHLYELICQSIPHHMGMQINPELSWSIITRCKNNTSFNYFLNNCTNILVVKLWYKGFILWLNSRRETAAHYRHDSAGWMEDIHSELCDVKMVQYILNTQYNCWLLWFSNTKTIGSIAPAMRATTLANSTSFYDKDTILYK